MLLIEFTEGDASKKIELRCKVMEISCGSITVLHSCQYDPNETNWKKGLS